MIHPGLPIRRHNFGDAAKQRLHRFIWGGESGWQLRQLETVAAGVNPDVRTFVDAGGGSYIDDVVSMRRDADGPAFPTGPGGEQTPIDYFYHQDDLASVVAITDTAGIVVERYEYGDYGQVNVLMADGVTVVPDHSVTGRKESTAAYAATCPALSPLRLAPLACAAAPPGREGADTMHQLS